MPSRKTIYFIFSSFFILVIGLSTIYQFSDGNKVAVKTIWDSGQIETVYGRIHRLILVSASWRNSGENACGDFTYLVWGTKGTGIAKVRVKQDNLKLIKEWKVIELAENSDVGLKVPCR